jgi:Uma2 family endonuclease
MAFHRHQNPFPGMNPFMDQRWSDAHLRMISGALEELGLTLPDAYSAIGQEHVSVEGSGSTGYYPDVAVVEETWRHGIPAVWTPEEAEAPESLAGSATRGRGARAPVRMPRIVRRELPKERWVEIRHDDGRLVTVIEIASPANRSSRRLEYLTKRADYLAAGVNVVEIDLLRTGRRLLDMTEEQLRDEFGPAEETYFISATRSFDPDRLEVYACPLREPLPCIHIPLRYPDLDVPLDIQLLVNRCYETGRYWKLDYTAPLTPPPSEEDARWIAERLRDAGLSRVD